MKIYVELIDKNENLIYGDWLELDSEIIDSWNDLSNFIDEFGGNEYLDYIITDYDGFGDAHINEGESSCGLDEIMEQIKNEEEEVSE